MSKFYCVLVSLFACTCFVMGWSDDAAIMEKLSLIFGGLLLGHVITEALNEEYRG